MPGEKPEDFTEERVWELLKPWVGPDDVEILRRPVYNFRKWSPSIGRMVECSSPETPPIT